MFLVSVLIALSCVSAVTVHIPGQGSVLGSQTTSAFTGRVINQFLGIRYAENPTGSLRFRAPIPTIPWTGTRDQTQPGRECPTFRNTMDIPSGSVGPELEDCLHVNVFTNSVSGDVCESAVF